MVVFGQILVALCFMEMAAQYPIAGSVYQWSKQLSTGFTSWMTGWIYIVGAIVTIAAVAVDWQVVLPQISTKFQILGHSADAGLTITKGGAQNALLLGAILITITTIINMLGVKLMSRINNVGVAAELIGATLLIILLLFHLHQPPSVIAHSYGYGAGHPWGYFGALLGWRPGERICDVRIRHGGNTRGRDEQSAQACPPGHHPRDRGRRTGGRPCDPAGHHVQQEHRRQEHRSAGAAVRDQERVREHHRERVPADTALAIFVCCLAVQTATIRMLFSMARDNRLPFGSQIARVSGQRKVPIVPALVTGILALVLMAVNVATTTRSS